MLQFHSEGWCVGKKIEDNSKSNLDELRALREQTAKTQSEKVPTSEPTPSVGLTLELLKTLYEEIKKTIFESIPSTSRTPTTPVLQSPFSLPPRVAEDLDTKVDLTEFSKNILSRILTVSSKFVMKAGETTKAVKTVFEVHSYKVEDQMEDLKMVANDSKETIEKATAKLNPENQLLC
ncbi:hypothetical protein L6452_21637 [Arctium lappa]|uniref:Uncharacterized protein n=1 Tax=Arctium lappa TaxID=4217 RepID=A0ACB9AZ87_ARCLA|nr:hypothetical protein L6452_21637 [Arctium lappa]